VEICQWHESSRLMPLCWAGPRRRYGFVIRCNRFWRLAGLDASWVGGISRWAERRLLVNCFLAPIICEWVLNCFGKYVATTARSASLRSESLYTSTLKTRFDTFWRLSLLGRAWAIPKSWKHMQGVEPKDMLIVCLFTETQPPIRVYVRLESTFHSEHCRQSREAHCLSSSFIAYIALLRLCSRWVPSPVTSVFLLSGGRSSDRFGFCVRALFQSRLFFVE